MKVSFLSVSWINSGMKYYPTKTNPVSQTSNNILDRNIAGTLLARNRASNHIGESVKDIESFRNRKKKLPREVIQITHMRFIFALRWSFLQT